MPELPEVEVTRLGLLPHLPGRRVVSVRWSNRRLRLPMPRGLLREWIRGHTIDTIDRRAKYLLIRMRHGSVLLVHLGMTGRLGIFAGDAPKQRHDHLCLALDNGMELRFNDSRRFGSITVWPGDHAARLEKEFSARQGIEPFSDAFTGDHLLALARRRRQPVKTLLMHSGIIAGIGNIYANEILYAAAIHPATPADRLDLRQWQCLARAGRRILADAIRAGGSTISDYLNASGAPGYFQLRLCVYGRKGDPCPTCGTPIRRTMLGGRATFFCPGCQHRED